MLRRPPVVRVFVGLLSASAVLGLDVLSGGCGRSERATASPPNEPMPAIGQLTVGVVALGDFHSDAPGVRRKLTLADLPPPYDTKSVDNGPHLVDRPEGVMPRVPDGFQVEVFARDLTNPRMIRTAPNGDLFVVESKANRARVLRDVDGDGKPDTIAIFTEGLKQPFGLAFHPPGKDPRWVYVANTDAVVRFPYVSGDLEARGAAELVVDDISGGGMLRGAVIGRAASSSRSTARRCTSPSARAPTSATTRGRRGALASSNSRPTERTSASTRRESGTRSASP